MLDWLERKMGWIAFPSIIRYLAFFQLGVVFLSFVNPSASKLLAFDWNLILEGQVWRLFSFIFIPVGTLAGGLNTVSIIFSIFAAWLLMMFSDGFESAWGTFRTTLFFLACWLSCIVASILFSTIFGVYNASGKLIAIPSILQPSMLFDYAILFAFAMLYPMYELRLFLIFPVPIFIIAIVGGVSVLSLGFLGVPFFFYSLLCLSPFLLLGLRKLIDRAKVKKHKVQFKELKKKSEIFHSCAACGVTDQDDDVLTFRVRDDGSEICENCLSKD